ncbi:MAG: MFS transporter [Candidatus Moraniibacteriota bacterium]
MNHFHYSSHIRSLHKPRFGYFKGRISTGFKALFVGDIFVSIGIVLFDVFFPIFIYVLLGNNIQAVAGYFLATYILHIILIFALTGELNKFGFRRALRLSSLVGALFFLSVFLLKGDNLWLMLPISVFCISLFRVLHWIPYNIDFAKFSNKKDRGKEISGTNAALSLVGIFTPIFAGYVVFNFGFNVLFLFGTLVYLLTYLPYLFLPRTNEKFSWSKKKMFKKILSSENRKAALIFFADGAETALSVFVWPIFIYVLLDGNLFDVGLISALVVGAMIFLQLIAGKYIDDESCNRDLMMKRGGFLYAAGWLLKIFAATALHIFIFDALHRFSRIFYRTPFETYVTEKSCEQKHLMDEYFVFREIALISGRVFMSILVIAMAFFVSVQWIFVLGALAALFLTYVHNQLKCSLR